MLICILYLFSSQLYREEYLYCSDAKRLHILYTSMYYTHVKNKLCDFQWTDERGSMVTCTARHSRTDERGSVAMCIASQTRI